ncbi:MAG: butyrate kinase [Lactobacillales bacterium]|nr:butyrate kinase [Lactobacillales bacterium]
MRDTILAINPGSTSTKVSLFSNGNLMSEETIRHSREELAQFPQVMDQKNFRKALIQEFLDEQGMRAEDFVAVAGRGGLLKPIPGGTYLVDEAMLEDLRSEKYGTHASNLGAILAAEFAKEFHVKPYIVDPVVVDEFHPVARISGLKGIVRRATAHVLNQKAVARAVLEFHGRTYKNSHVIVAHLGGGISIGAHKNGKIIDANNGLDGEGPYTPERTGGLPVMAFAEKILKEKLTMPEIKQLLAGNGGLKSYMNETDVRVITAQMAHGNREAKYYLDGMCYQIQKEIGEMAAVLEGKVDFIILTGGMSFSDYVVEKIKERVSWIAPVEVLAGEMEMKALYEGVSRVLNHEESAKCYAEIEVAI